MATANLKLSLTIPALLLLENHSITKLINCWAWKNLFSNHTVRPEDCYPTRDASTKKERTKSSAMITELERSSISETHELKGLVGCYYLIVVEKEPVCSLIENFLKLIGWKPMMLPLNSKALQPTRRITSAVWKTCRLKRSSRSSESFWVSCFCDNLKQSWVQNRP